MTEDFLTLEYKTPEHVQMIAKMLESWDSPVVREENKFEIKDCGPGRLLRKAFSSADIEELRLAGIWIEASWLDHVILCCLGRIGLYTMNKLCAKHHFAKIPDPEKKDTYLIMDRFGDTGFLRDLFTPDFIGRLKVEDVIAKPSWE